MLGFWNKKEVYSGYSIGECARIRDIIGGNKINYSYKVVNRNTSSAFGTTRSHIGSFGGRSDLENEYFIYVHKDDYDAAIHFIYEGSR